MLIAESSRTLQDFMNELNCSIKEVGLKIHVCKGLQMKDVWCCGFDVRLKNRMSRLWTAVSSRSRGCEQRSARITERISTKPLDIFTVRKMNLPVKSNSTFLPMLLCGCEKRNITFEEERKLAVTDCALERCIVGITQLQHISNEDLRFRSSLKDNVERFAPESIAGSIMRQEWTTIDGQSRLFVASTKYKKKAEKAIGEVERLACNESRGRTNHQLGMDGGMVANYIDGKERFEMF